VATCAFTVEERSSLNSPLLDGLWFAATLQIPSATAFSTVPEAEAALFVQQASEDNQRLFMRLMRSKLEFVDAVAFLLERGVDATANTNEPLEVAVSRGHSEICDALFRAGARMPLIPFQMYQSAFAIGSLPTVRVLHQYADVKGVTYPCEGKNLLDVVFETNDIPEIVLWLIDQGVRCHGSDILQYMISKSIQYQRVQSFHVLINRLQVKVELETELSLRSTNDDRTSEGSENAKKQRLAAALAVPCGNSSPLHSASSSFAYDRSSSSNGPTTFFIDALLALGVPVDCRSSFGETPLMHACADNDFERARRLIEHGADVNAISDPGGAGCTPLSRACDWTQFFNTADGNLELVRLLVERGAELELPIKHGRTALAIAARRNSPSVLLFLLERGAKFEPGPDTPLMEPILCSVVQAYWPNAKSLQALLERGANINLAAQPGLKTALHHAVTSRVPLSTCQFLLKRGANPNARDADGQTPLHLAAAIARSHRDESELVPLLVQFGADVAL